MKKQVASIFLFAFVSFTLNISAFTHANIVNQTNQKIINAITIPKSQNATLEDLLKQLPEESQEVAHSLLAKRYEGGKRSIIGATQYGLAFQIYPEELMDLIPFIKGNKKILGLASADGINELFLSLFTEGENAETHIADIAPDEIALCKEHLTLLPENHRQKVTTHCNDIYDLKVKLAHLEGQFDLILARNIFHFIKPSEHAKFLGLAKFFLKDSGKLVIGVHTSKMATEFNASCFQSVTYFVYNKDRSQKKIIRTSPRPLDPKTKNIDFLQYHSIYADYRINSSRFLTQAENLEVINNQEAKAHAQNFLNTHPLSKGEYLRVLINTMQYLSATTLLKILHKNALCCEGISYYHLASGHRINLDKIDYFGGFLCVVCSKSEVEKLHKESFEASQKIQALTRGKLVRLKSSKP